MKILIVEFYTWHDECIYTNCMLTDLYGLSSCDYIIGPPSTFSQWASFWGKTPLRVLYSANETLLLSDFKRVVALDTFE